MTSLMFHVVNKRINSRPLIIWKEYRTHAVLFTWRAMIANIFAWQYIYRWIGICIIHMIVDYFQETQTVRHLNEAKGFKAWMKKLYSLYQFQAMVSHILPSEYVESLAFNTLIAIQSSAFLMTLHKKGFIHARTHAIVYGLSLILSSSVMIYLTGWIPLLYAIIAFGFRNLNTKKYLIWSGLIIYVTFIK
jgi:hypothetical protein